MSQPQERIPGPDDTAAFQAFYAAPSNRPRDKGLVYRIFVGWWRDRT